MPAAIATEISEMISPESIGWSHPDGAKESPSLRQGSAARDSRRMREGVKAGWRAGQSPGVRACWGLAGANQVSSIAHIRIFYSIAQRGGGCSDGQLSTHLQVGQ